ncbi:hypothetical protein C8T65DRAFT_631352 [Cerioporus squamosus]|nr:hypothetical protein C8T65DRAFT_631352 [Cerioporus squamosus]
MHEARTKGAKQIRRMQTRATRYAIPSEPLSHRRLHLPLSRSSEPRLPPCLQTPSPKAQVMSEPEVLSLAPSDSTAAAATTSPEQPSARPLAQTSGGRVSGKTWKAHKAATVYVCRPVSQLCQTSRIVSRRSLLPDGLKTKKWEDRMEKTKKEQAIKKLQAELKEEKASEIQRRKEITMERKKAAEERRRLEEDKAKMGARKAARLRRKAGRTKKINH